MLNNGIVDYVEVREEKLIDLIVLVDDFEVLYTNRSFSVCVVIGKWKLHANEGDYLARREDGSLHVLNREEFQKQFI